MRGENLMWKRRFGSGIVVATALLSRIAAAAVGAGDPAPDFTLNDLSGVPHTLSSLRGQVVLLAFVGYG